MACLAGPQGLRLLLVDADPAAGGALARQLTTAGHRVDRVEGWRDGLIRAVSDDPHLILIARDLPEVEGASLVRILRACGRPTPVLLLSRTDGPAVRGEALAAGADDLFADPLSQPTALLARIAALARPSLGRAANTAADRRRRAPPALRRR
jgi:DNA-binding response OmpR family regulator